MALSSQEQSKVIIYKYGDISLNTTEEHAEMPIIVSAFIMLSILIYFYKPEKE